MSKHATSPFKESLGASALETLNEALEKVGSLSSSNPFLHASPFTSSIDSCYVGPQESTAETHKKETQQKDSPNFWTLPKVKGRYLFSYKLSKLTWFKVGGAAEVLFKPEDENDLSLFLKEKDPSMPVTILGAASNVLIRDGGIKGVVIKLGKEFASIHVEDTLVTVGSACLDRTLVLECAQYGLGGLEFLVGIPGTIGGAIAMNAGAYGFEVKDYLEWVECMDQSGNLLRLSKDRLQMTYRNGNLPSHTIVTRACFRLLKRPCAEISELIEDNLYKREISQPIKGRTGGSTFKNPKDSSLKAWELIDQAGCRGLRIDDAQISEKHCNFMLNTDQASAKDLENLGNKVKEEVFNKTGVSLEWEIIRLGEI